VCARIPFLDSFHVHQPQIRFVHQCGRLQRVVRRLGRHPRRGESVHLPGYEIVVTDLARVRVTQVQVIERPETAEAAASGA
jgi:CBS domain containing-hemolysin-like protein